MGPKAIEARTDHDLFRTELVNLIDQRHELVKLGELIDWQAFADKWSPQFVSTTGRPALPTRLMAALLHPWPDRRFAVKHPRWEPSA
jgi:IS5 family transposase